MTPCERLSDRMPAVAAGRIAWTVEDVTHLDACADCRAEWRLVAAVQRIGPGVAGRGDPEATAAAVLARLQVAEPEVQDGVLVAPLGDAKPEVVNRELVLAGVSVRELVVDRPQLEDVFVALTGEGFDVDQ